MLFIYSMDAGAEDGLYMQKYRSTLSINYIKKAWVIPLSSYACKMAFWEEFLHVGKFCRKS